MIKHPRMPAVLLALTLATGGALVAATAPSAVAATTRGAAGRAPIATAYAYANKPTGHNYTPEKGYFFNSSGGGVKINKSATGKYVITFFGLGAEAAGGTVDVTAEGANLVNAAICSVVSWGPSAGNLIVNVDCFNLSGAAMNTLFMAAFTSGGNSTGTTAYAWANKDTTASYTPNAAYQFDSTGGTIKIHRISVGEYFIKVPGPAVTGGTVKVTAYGPGPDSCQVVNWGKVAAGQDIYVDCFNKTGATANHEFTLTFAATDGLLGDGGPSGYVWGDDPTSAGYSPMSLYQYDTAGTSATVTRFATGEYSVSFPAASAGDMGDEQATAYGPALAHCIVDGPAGTLGGTQTADVYCFDNSGNLVDTTYTMQWFVT